MMTEREKGLRRLDRKESYLSGDNTTPWTRIKPPASLPKVHVWLLLFKLTVLDLSAQLYPCRVVA